MSADLVAAGGVKIDGVAVHGDDVWWAEIRPAEQGRVVLVSSVHGDRLPPPWSARSRVHEYGGGSWWFGHDHVYFVNQSDQAVYRLPVGDSVDLTAEPERVTALAPSGQTWRFADGNEHPDGSFIVCVRETHSEPGSGGDASPGPIEPTNEIVAVPVAGNGGTGAEPIVLVTGPDFVAEPRVSPDGRFLSWVQWDHPNMPWNDTTLLVAPLRPGVHSDEGQRIGIGPGDVVADGAAVCGADWTANGDLVYSNDADGFWNLYRWSPSGGTTSLTAVTGGEIGASSWVFGLRRWVELADGRLVACVTRDAVDTLAVVRSDFGLTPVPGFDHDGSFGPDTPVAINTLAAAGPTAPSAVIVVAATPTSLAAIMSVDVDSGTSTSVHAAPPIGVGSEWLSVPEPFWFDSDGRRTHGFFYRPPLAVAGVDGDEKPPLVVIGHGGPTIHSGPELSLKVQYWTSRGFAVVDVNYGGSTGFGREYRDRLHLSWGVVDVDDCVNAALHLAAEGLVDGDRLAIRGSSSGGLTVLLALIQSDRFAAGVSLYGVADLMALAADTHKFESRYLDWLIGAYPEDADRYDARSPMNRATDITTPMLLMQGSEDTVVPPSQSEAVVAALAANEVDHAYVVFEGESHGFRQADTIARSMELELWFYSRVFGFDPADDVPAPVDAVGRGLGLTDSNP